MPLPVAGLVDEVGWENQQGGGRWKEDLRWEARAQKTERESARESLRFYENNTFPSSAISYAAIYFDF